MYVTKTINKPFMHSGTGRELTDYSNYTKLHAWTLKTWWDFVGTCILVCMSTHLCYFLFWMHITFYFTVWYSHPGPVRRKVQQAISYAEDIKTSLDSVALRQIGPLMDHVLSHLQNAALALKSACNLPMKAVQLPVQAPKSGRGKLDCQRGGFWRTSKKKRQPPRKVLKLELI